MMSMREYSPSTDKEPRQLLLSQMMESQTFKLVMLCLRLIRPNFQASSPLHCPEPMKHQRSFPGTLRFRISRLLSMA